MAIRNWSDRHHAGTTDEPVEITWRGTIPEWVQPSRDWVEHCTAQELLSRVVELVNARMVGARGDWRAALSLSGLRLHELGEFNALVSEARAEAEQAPPAIQVATTRHLRAVWHSGRLIELTADPIWIATVGPAGFAAELTDAVQPVSDADTTTVARDRLIRYLGGASV